LEENLTLKRQISTGIILRNKPVLAFYSSRNRTLQNLPQLLRSNTWRRSLIKTLAQILSTTGLYKLLPLSSNGTKLIDCLNSVSNTPVSSCLMTWQGDTQRKRIYGYAYLGDSDKPVFVKYGEGEANANLFQNETDALKVINDGKYQFSTTHLITSKISKEESILVSECLPHTAKNIQPSTFQLPPELLALSTNKREITPSELSRQKWWSEYEKIARKAAPEFYKKTASTLKLTSSITTTTCHGDAGSENIFSADSGLLVIDWERYSSTAPLLTDPVGYWLGINHTLIANSPAIEASRIKQWANLKKYKTSDIIFALSYLISCNFRPAIQIAEKFVKNKA